jgi:transcriptional regulator with XRE-family HTH domain
MTMAELPRCSSLDGVAMRLAARVRERRVDAGLTQAELALRAGVTVETVSRLERLLHGRPSPGSNPTLETLARLSEALGVEITELLANRSGPDSSLDKLSASLRQATPAARRRVLRVAEALLHEDLPLLRSAADGEDFDANAEDDGLREVATGEPSAETELPPSGSRFLMDGPAVPKAQN